MFSTIQATGTVLFFFLSIPSWSVQFDRPLSDGRTYMPNRQVSDVYVSLFTNGRVDELEASDLAILLRHSPILSHDLPLGSITGFYQDSLGAHGLAFQQPSPYLSVFQLACIVLQIKRKTRQTKDAETLHRALERHLQEQTESIFEQAFEEDSEKTWLREVGKVAHPLADEHLGDTVEADTAFAALNRKDIFLEPKRYQVIKTAGEAWFVTLPGARKEKQEEWDKLLFIVFKGSVKALLDQITRTQQSGQSLQHLSDQNRDGFLWSVRDILKDVESARWVGSPTFVGAIAALVLAEFLASGDPIARQFTRWTITILTAGVGGFLGSLTSRFLIPSLRGIRLILKEARRREPFEEKPAKTYGDSAAMNNLQRLLNQVSVLDCARALEKRVNEK